MPKVVGIKFKNTAKVYYFSAGTHKYTMGCGVIAETARGTEYGTLAMMPTDVSDSEIVQPLKPVVRVATEKDEANASSFFVKIDQDGGRSPPLRNAFFSCRFFRR